ncbi:MAG TPA: hypothetical protein VHV08_05405 [Pirellulales bacterium]|nr:hypothetical protein [Pirellulales bacterium]
MPSVTSIGKVTLFYIPSHKLDAPRQDSAGTARSVIHEFLISNFKAYTHTPAPVKGYWISDEGTLLHDVMEQFEVSFESETEFEALIAFLAGICDLLAEDTIYLTRGDDSFLVRK